MFANPNHPHRKHTPFFLRWASFCVAIIALWALQAHAALDIELTKGIASGVPMTIMPFENESKTPLAFSELILNDLQKSGRFNAALPQADQPTVRDVSHIDKRYWQKQGSDYVLLGNVVPEGGSKYQVSFSLVDLYQQKVGKSGQTATADQVVLEKTFTISAQDARRLGHKIADLVYETITGDKGIFSTKIVYVLVKREPAALPTEAEREAHVLARQPKATYVLEVADVDGANPTQIFKSDQPILSPSWSPSGKFMTFVSFENGRSEIYVERLSDGMRKKIASFKGINSAPAWSPDGSKLAMVLSKTGKAKIYVYDLKTQAMDQITDRASIDTEPHWAPDAKSLIFTSNRGGSPQLYQVFLDTKKVKRLTFKGRYNASGHFLPDGKSIIFLHYVGGRFTIAIQDLESGHLKELTRTGMEETPSISPNGKMIVFASKSGGHGVLGMVSVDGRVNLRLPAQAGDVQAPAWSPFMG